MKKEYQDIISGLLKVEPVFINSKDFSAQNRQRLYWTNIPVRPWSDKGLVLKDILEVAGHVDRDKSFCLDANYWKGGNLKSYFEKNRRQLVFNRCLQVGEADIKGIDSIKRVYSPEGKAPALTTCGGGHREPKVYVPPLKWRKLTPIECERLQTVPDNYTSKGIMDDKEVKISNTQRYKMLGNGWTIDVIAHIFGSLQKGVVW